MCNNKWNEESKNYFVLSLREIASWQVPALRNEGKIVAGVPSLQRGAIWAPQQIEMLWDSIFRGFPIGSIVVIKKIDKQRNQIPNTQKNRIDLEPTHHILDGQQRCNAIAWGFVDPRIEGNKDDEILWLDLLPKKEHLHNTTREYLFRMTTKAHPWGFDSSDNAGQLPVTQRDNFLEKLEESDGEKITGRPEPKKAFPAIATFPVPVFLLFKHFDGNHNHIKWEEFWREEWVARIFSWSGKSMEDFNAESKGKIEKGLQRAIDSRLIALSVPDGVEGIESVEKIFQRLNGQGTPLSNEDLIYSMMKAYWPEIEDVISHIETPPITDARLVNLGVRAALTQKGAPLSPVPSLKRIRELFNEQSEKYAEDENKTLRSSIKAYFEPDRDNELSKALAWIDTNLLYSSERTYGLPAYLRSSIAWSSPDVFAWLILLAKNSPQYEDEFLKKVIGFALAIHWFGTNKEEAAKQLCKLNPDEFLNKTLSEIKNNKSEQIIFTILSPADLGNAFQLTEHSSSEQLSKWTSFWKGVVEHNEQGQKYDDEVANMRRNEYGLLIEKLRQLPEILIYAQRDYVSKCFHGFDPANKLMWQGYNRPWDYDHILPSAKLNATGSYTKESLQFHDACKAWQSSIGNLVAIDFSYNRKARDIVKPFEKYKTEKSKDKGVNVFASDDALRKFDLTLRDLEKGSPMAPALDFVLAAKNRLINIYDEWYANLNVVQYAGHSKKPTIDSLAQTI